MDKIEHLIKELNLEPHPEGGYFRETYRSEGFVNQFQYQGKNLGHRNYCTCIYFLLTSESFSAFHRIKQDEIWHFYRGNPIDLYEITSEGKLRQSIIGNNLENGEIPQLVVKAGNWFAAKVTGKGYSLVGCTVSPGFSFEDFEMGERKSLIAKFPQHESIIKEFTRI